MDAPTTDRARRAATSVARRLGIDAREHRVLNSSNRMVLHVLPGDAVLRVALRAARESFALEARIVEQLQEVGAPVARLDPRSGAAVHEEDGFVVTVWEHHPPRADALTEADYAGALRGLHAGLRRVDLEAPHALDRVAEARRAVTDREETPELSEEGRELISNALDGGERLLRDHGGKDQLLHGEPHLENVLATMDGVLALDFETCCRGPVEFDLAHCFGPSATGLGFTDRAAVLDAYPEADPELVDASRQLIIAMITTWRWIHTDRLPGRDRWRRWGLETLGRASADHDSVRQ